MAQVSMNTVGAQESVLPLAQKQTGVAQQTTEKTPVNAAASADLYTDIVEIGQPSGEQSFAVEAKSRQEAIHEALQRFTEQGKAANPFEGSGDNTYKQSMVFNQHLEESGFFDGKSQEEIGKTQGLIKDITSAMEMIAPSSSLSGTANSPSAAAAQIAFSSSVQALRQFVDSELSGDLADSFSDLIDSYASYNEPLVANHRSAADRQDQHLAQASRNKSYAKLARTAPRPDAVSARLGRVKHSSQQKQRIRDAASSYFQDVRSGTISVDSAISKLQGSFLSGASGGTQDGEVRSVLIRRNSALFQQINSYWGVLMRTQ